MKIAMVSPTVVPAGPASGHIGGAETYAYSLSNELAKLGHSVLLITTSRNSAQTCRLSDNFEIRYLPYETAFSWGSNDPFSHKIAGVLLKENYDLVHIHQIFSSFNVISCLVGKMRGITSYGTDHGGGPIIYRIFPRICIDLPDYLVTVSDFSLNHLQGILPDKKAFVAYGGVDTEIYRPDYDVSDLKKKHNLDGYRVVLCVGRLISCKGFDLAVKAMQYLPADVKLLVVGPATFPSYNQYLQTLAQPYGDRVVFVGHASAKDLPRYYNLCDVFVRSSVNDDCFGHHYNFPELLGLVKFEAMACGKPVVVTDIGGLPEQVISGQHGYVVKPNERDLADALNRVLSDDVMRRWMGQQSLAFVRANFSWRSIAEKVADFYKATR